MFFRFNDICGKTQGHSILTAGSPISIDFMHICRGFLLKLPVHLNILWDNSEQKN